MNGATTHRFRLLETEVVIRCDDGRLAEKLASLLAPFHVSAPADEGEAAFSVVSTGASRLRLLRGVNPIHEGSDSSVMTRIVAELNALALRESSHLTSHCGVVAHGRAAVAFPAPSGGGKSTITAACVRAGFWYASDEALCVDRATDAVVPYPKPLTLATATLSRLGIGMDDNTGDEALLRAEDLGGKVVHGRLRLAHVVIMERAGGPPRLEELPRSRAVASILRFAFNHYKDPRGSFRAVVGAVGGSRAWRLSFSDPVAGASLLRSRFGT